MKIQFSRASEKIRSNFFSRFFEIETLVNDCHIGRAVSLCSLYQTHQKNLGSTRPLIFGMPRFRKFLFLKPLPYQYNSGNVCDKFKPGTADKHSVGGDHLWIKHMIGQQQKRDDNTNAAQLQ